MIVDLEFQILFCFQQSLIFIPQSKTLRYICRLNALGIGASTVYCGKPDPLAGNAHTLTSSV